MAKWPKASAGRRRSFLLLLTLTCLAAYIIFFDQESASSSLWSLSRRWEQTQLEEGTDCCRGLSHTELWGEAVKWGSDFLLNSAQACCDACATNPRCNSWVYCGEEAGCGSMYRQCWLKRQKDPLNPEVHKTGPSVPWTSGLAFKNDVGIVELVTNNATIRIQLLPDCAPKAVNHILELLKIGHCSGCRFVRAEGRGEFWNTAGNHISQTGVGPPYAVVQGILEVQHVPFKKMPIESRPAIKRGMVGWVGTGPDFFISLANHGEWPRKHTVFGTVVTADMPLIDNLVKLPTTKTTWTGVEVEILDNPVNLKLQRPRKR